MKMKNLMLLFAALVMTGFAFTACSDDDDPEDIRVESVTLDESLKDGAKLFVGETLNIAGKVTITPANATNKKEVYNSAKPEVATVSEAGLVTAVAEGSSTITITVDGKSASFTLNVVNEDNYVAVTEVVLPDELKGGVELTLGDNLDISGKVTVLPANATIKTEAYSSDDEEVATVSDAGLVTAVAEGTAKITITVDGKSASFDVTVVTGDGPEVAEIKLTQNEVDIDLEPAETFDIKTILTVLPEDAGYKRVTYASEDEDIAEVSAEGVVTPVTAGTTNITITSLSNEEVTATLTVNVLFSGDYERSSWEIASHYPELWVASGTENNTTEFLFEDENTADATYFGLIRPGKFWGPEENPTIDNRGADAYIEFVIDTKKLHKVNYFRFQYRPNLPQLRYRQIERIYGSNDGVEFKDITDDFTPIPNYDVGTISQNVAIPTSTYRYFKFWCQSDEDCFKSIKEGASGQIRKIWLGYDPDLE